MPNTPITTQTLTSLFHLDGKKLQRQYRNHFSDYQEFKQKHKGKNHLVFPHNLSEALSIDETALSNDELYIIATSKKAKGKKGALVAMVQGPMADKITDVLQQIPKRLRYTVKEVRVNIAVPLHAVIKHCFPQAHRLIERCACTATGF